MAEGGTPGETAMLSVSPTLLVRTNWGEGELARSRPAEKGCKNLVFVQAKSSRQRRAPVPKERPSLGHLSQAAAEHPSRVGAAVAEEVDQSNLASL